MSDWINSTLGEQISTLRNGVSFEQVDSDTDFPVTRIETISTGFVDHSRLGFVEFCSEHFLLKSSDILLSNINSVKHIGKCAQYDGAGRLYHGMNLLLLRFSNHLDAKFIFELLRLNKPWFERYCAVAVNQASINQTQIRELPLSFPKELPEQQKIAEVLSTVDEAIELTQRAIEKQTSIKAGLMQELLTKGLDEHGNIRAETTHQFKDSKLGRIPKDWEIYYLDQIAENLDSRRIPIKKGDRKSGSYPYYGATGIVDYVANFIFEEELLLISEDGANLVDRNYPIAFTATGNYWVNNHAHIYRFSERATHQLTQWYLNMINLENYLTGMAQPKLNTGQLNSIPIRLPINHKERENIQNILKESDRTIITLQTKKSKLESLKRGLMAELLTGKTRVTSLLS